MKGSSKDSMDDQYIPEQCGENPLRMGGEFGLRHIGKRLCFSFAVKKSAVSLNHTGVFRNIYTPGQVGSLLDSAAIYKNYRAV